MEFKEYMEVIKPTKINCARYWCKYIPEIEEKYQKIIDELENIPEQFIFYVIRRRYMNKSFKKEEAKILQAYRMALKEYKNGKMNIEDDEKVNEKIVNEKKVNEEKINEEKVNEENVNEVRKIKINVKNIKVQKEYIFSIQNIY